MVKHSTLVLEAKSTNTTSSLNLFYYFGIIFKSACKKCKIRTVTEQENPSTIKGLLVGKVTVCEVALGHCLLDVHSRDPDEAEQ